jgi:hypothetical protein
MPVVMAAFPEEDGEDAFDVEDPDEPVVALPWAVVAGVVGVVPVVVAGALVVAPVPGVVTTTVLGAVDVEFKQVVDPPV